MYPGKTCGQTLYNNLLWMIQIQVTLRLFPARKSKKAHNITVRLKIIFQFGVSIFVQKHHLRNASDGKWNVTDVTRESVGIHTSMFLPETILYLSICCLSNW